MVERWRQLPLDQALSYAGRVRTLVQSLADEVAEARGVPPSMIPDLGPATLMDQLTVLVHDATTTEPTSPTLASLEVPPQAVAPREAPREVASQAVAPPRGVTSQEVAPPELASREVASREVESTLANDLATLRRQLR